MKRNPAIDSTAAAPEGLTRNHLRRLRQYFRSAGWPCQDNIELDLLERGFVRRDCVAGGMLESIVVTDAGIGLLSRQLERNRNAHAEHEALVERVACWLKAQKRLVFRGVALRTRLDSAWALSKPDVFSLRHVTSSRHLHPGGARDQSAAGRPARRPEERIEAPRLPVVLAIVPLRDRRRHRGAGRKFRRTVA